MSRYLLLALLCMCLSGAAAAQGDSVSTDPALPAEAAERRSEAARVRQTLLFSAEQDRERMRRGRARANALGYTFLGNCGAVGGGALLRWHESQAQAGAGAALLAAGGVVMTVDLVLFAAWHRDIVYYLRNRRAADAEILPTREPRPF